jgi:outer membrane protein
MVRLLQRAIRASAFLLEYLGIYMKMTTLKIGLGSALIAGLALSVPAANAQGMSSGDMPDVNLIGIAGGVAPDWMGSSDHKGAAGPLFRYQFSGTQRYVAWVGPMGMFNVLDDENWRFGPMVNFRGGRGGDVDNSVVQRMVGINNTWEGGAFVQYRYKLSEEKMHQIVFTLDVAGGSNGTVSNPRMLWWQPLGPSTILNLGLGTTFGNSKWMNTYFGLNNANDIRLFPGTPATGYQAGSGIKGVNIPIGLTQALSKEWLLSAGVRYEKLQGDAKDSPIVQQQGNSNQWIGGVGLSYLFKELF